MNGLTARQSLDLLKLSPGQVIAVTGAAGAYGGYVIQLAKTEGLTVIADASEKDEKLVLSLGADIVVRRGDDVASRIRSRFPQGVDGLADGAVLNALAIPAVRDGGAFTSVRGFQGVPQRDIHFTTTMGALLRAGIREARSASAPGRGRRNHASRGGGLSAGKGGRGPSPAGGWRYERTAGHPILMARSARRPPSTLRRRSAAGDIKALAPCDDRAAPPVLIRRAPPRPRLAPAPSPPAPRRRRASASRRSASTGWK